MIKYTAFGILSIVLAIVFILFFNSVFIIFLTLLSGLPMMTLVPLLMPVVGIFFGFSARKNGTLTAKILGTIGFIMNCTILIIFIVNTIVNPDWAGFFNTFSSDI